MDDLKYTATLDDQISPKLKKIEENTRKVIDRMAALSGAIAGLAVGAAIGNAIRFADSISDITSATGIAEDAIIGLTNAVQLNGGTAEQASQAIYKLVQSVGEAANGGKAAQNAFGQIGITLQDLATLSEQDLLAKTVKGLAGIADTSQRAVLTTELLGKSFRGIDVGGVANGYAQATINSGKYAESVRQAAELQNKFDLAMQRFQLSVLKATEPFIKFINKLDDEKIGKVIDAITSLAVQIGVAAAALVALEKVAKVFLVIAGMAAALTGGLKILGGTVTSLKIQWGGLMKDLDAGRSKKEALGKTIETIATKRMPFFVKGIAMIAKGLLGWAGVLMVINDTVELVFGKSLTQYLGMAYDKVKQFLGLVDKVEETQSAAETARLQRQNAAADAQEKEKTRLRDVQDAYEGQRKKLDEISQNYAKQNGLLIKNIDFEATLIGKSEQQIELQRALNDLQQRGADEVEKLRTAKQNLTKDEQHLAGAYDEQIKKIQAQTQADAVRLTNSITKLQQANLQEQARLNLIDATTKQLEKQIAIEERLRGAALDIQREMSNFEIEGMTNEFDRGLAQIQSKTDTRIADIRKSFEEMIDENVMDPSDVQRYTEALIQLEAQVKKLGDAERERFIKNNPQTFADSWAKAFEDYSKNVNNAANRGRDAFNSVMGNMNNAIDNFVETGKFSFSDFARSVIQDLIKIELKAAASKLFSSMFSSAGGWLSSLLGFANGGTPPLNKPSIVGEQGPELFVPRSAGTVVPGKDVNLGGGGSGQAIVNNTYVTNNISAVDAKSVAQLFAENRKTLLGTVRMAEKEMPYGR